MTWTVDQSGTESISAATETTLGSASTNNGTFVWKFDLGALASGEQIIARIKTKVLSGGTARIAWQGTYGALSGTANMTTPIIMSPPTPSDVSIECTLQFVSAPAASRSIPWSLLRI